MAREPIDPLWQQVHRALLNKLALERQMYLELHEDFIYLQYMHQCAMSVIYRQARKDRFEIAQREAREIIEK